MSIITIKNILGWCLRREKLGLDNSNGHISIVHEGGSPVTISSSKHVKWIRSTAILAKSCARNGKRGGALKIKFKKYHKACRALPITSNIVGSKFYPQLGWGKLSNNTCKKIVHDLSLSVRLRVYGKNFYRTS